MESSKWGSHLWFYLHTVSFNYPQDNPTEEQKINIYKLFENLQYTLPCKYCRDSYKIFFKYFDIKYYLNDRMGLTFYVYVLHNLVNMKLNKSRISFIDAINNYEKIRANTTFDINKNKLFAYNAERKYNNITKKLINKIIHSDESPIPLQSWTQPCEGDLS